MGGKRYIGGEKCFGKMEYYMWGLKVVKEILVTKVIYVFYIKIFLWVKFFIYYLFCYVFFGV